ncbi:hypothetical protein VHEMI09620 [[Torrubiella] hemipterigena]|uniref:Uncharacterized protein n=1 Tax=[Torrubiella] hemipterigena TaxID=1531966 RepID=A0A0A1TAD9_9HYPO|nr:hypothetical protein VHEMI09620 [[Torrubiella] hemipterigena]
MPSYILTGRGGAGNARTSQTTAAPAKQPSATSYSTTPRYMSSGIGGAGNIHVSSSAAAHAAAQNDMRTAAEAASRPAPAAYTGRGGAGNVYRSRQSSTSSAGSSVYSAASSSSSMSSKAKAWASSAFGRS